MAGGAHGTPYITKNHAMTRRVRLPHLLT